MDKHHHKTLICFATEEKTDIECYRLLTTANLQAAEYQLYRALLMPPVNRF